MLALQSELIAVLTSDAELLGDVVGGLDHGEGAVDIGGLALGLAFGVGVHQGLIAVAHAEAHVADIEGGGAHALDAAAEHDVGVIALDLLHAGEHGLHAGGALTMDGVGGGGLGDLEHQGGDTGDVGGVGGLLGLTGNDLIEHVLADAGLLDGALIGSGQQLLRQGVLQRAADGADGSTDCGYDDYFFHGFASLHINNIDTALFDLFRAALLSVSKRHTKPRI